MAFYIGSKQECEDYNKQVTAGENYKPKTIQWSRVVFDEYHNAYAIKKHENYLADMQEIENLTIKDENE